MILKYGWMECVFRLFRMEGYWQQPHWIQNDELGQASPVNNPDNTTGIVVIHL
jgi:hypothetical protein